MPASPKLLVFTFIAFAPGAYTLAMMIGASLQASDSLIILLLLAIWFPLLLIFIPLWVKAPKLEEVSTARSWTQSSWAAEANRYYGGRSSSGSSRDTEHGAGLGGGYGGGCGCGCGCHH